METETSFLWLCRSSSSSHQLICLQTSQLGFIHHNTSFLNVIILQIYKALHKDQRKSLVSTLFAKHFIYGREGVNIANQNGDVDTFPDHYSTKETEQYILNENHFVSGSTEGLNWDGDQYTYHVL